MVTNFHLIIETYSFWNSLSKIENHFDLLIVMLYHICCLVSLITNLQYNVNIESLSMCSSQKNHDLHVTFVIALSLRGARDGKPLGPHLIQQRWNSLTTTKAAVWTTIYMLQISNTIIELHHSPQPQSHHI